MQGISDIISTTVSVLAEIVEAEDMRHENKKNNYLFTPQCRHWVHTLSMRKVLRMPLGKLIEVEVGAGVYVCISFETEGDLQSLEVIGKVAGQLEVPG